MKTKSTYSMLLNADSDDKGRSMFETAVCSVAVLCIALTVWAFASTSMVIPGQARVKDTTKAQIAQVVAEQPALAAVN